MPKEVLTDERSSPLPTALGNSIFKDFYLSFGFSQGSSDLQRLLMTAVARTYETGEILEYFPASSDLYRVLTDRVEKLHLPPQHTTTFPYGGGMITEADIRATGRVELSVQMRILECFHYGSLEFSAPPVIFAPEFENDMRSSEEELLTKVSQLMVERELFYLRRGRPEKVNEDDAYRSYIKLHALDHEPTSSKVFDSLFQKVGEILQGEELCEQLRELVTVWGVRHPHESFFSSP